MSGLAPFDPAGWPWPEGVRPIQGGVTAASGVRAGWAAAGIKKPGKTDVAVLVCDEPAAAAAMFTTNLFAAPPVVLTRNHLEAGGMLRAVAVNAGNANACTGPRGFDDAVAMAETLAGLVGCSSWEVGVSSTGVIGVPLPMDKVVSGICEAFGSLSGEGGAAAAEAIMTTDTFPKECAVEVALSGGAIRIGGMAKGGGMIRPNMATMLSFVTTDAALAPAQARALLAAAVAPTFNRITVDGETSTNDMVLLLATGAAQGASGQETDSGSATAPSEEEHGAAIVPGSPDEAVFAAALHAVLAFLSRMVVRDGEGATKTVSVTVGEAPDEGAAELLAFAVAESALVKTALAGEDANWGRVLSAMGAAGVPFAPEAVWVRFGPHLLAQQGAAVGFDEDVLAGYLAGDELSISIGLSQGAAEATVWTTDLTCDYVKINADYRT
jgi:glutamate N-acetyltransferase / amino-acid N-acetyltransferase